MGKPLPASVRTSYIYVYTYVHIVITQYIFFHWHTFGVGIYQHRVVPSLQVISQACEIFSILFTHRKTVSSAASSTKRPDFSRGFGSWVERYLPLRQRVSVGRSTQKSVSKQWRMERRGITMPTLVSFHSSSLSNHCCVFIYHLSFPLSCVYRISLFIWFSTEPHSCVCVLGFLSFRYGGCYVSFAGSSN